MSPLRTWPLWLLLATPALAQDEAPPETPEEPAAWGGTFTAPVMERCPEAAWPEGQPEDGVRTVELLVVIEPTGRVSQVEVVKGEGAFAKAAEAVVRECTFTPAMESGEPIAVEVPLSWVFEPPVAELGGVVRAYGDRNPLPDLELMVGEQRVTTGPDGRFVVPALGAGTYAVRLVGDRYRMPETRVTVEAGEAVDLEIWVFRPQGSESEAVGVYRKVRDTVVRRSITREDARVAPGSMGDPVRAIQNLTGVVRTPLDSGWLLVRGGNPRQAGIFLDGVHIPLLYHLGGFTSVLHPEMLDGIDFMPGAWPVRYGNATSGVVDLIPRRVTGDFQINAGFNLLYAHTFAEVPIGKVGGLALALRRSYLDAILGLVLEPEQASIAPQFWDGQVKFDSEKFGLMVVGMSDTIDTPTGNEDEVVTVVQGAIQVQGRGTFEVGGGILEFKPWFAQQTRELDVTGRVESLRELHPGLRLEWASDQELPLRFLVGTEAEYTTWDFVRDGTSRDTPMVEAAPYASVSFGDVVQATAGVRLDTLWLEDQDLRWGLSPRASLRWKAAPGLTFVGEGGLYHQAPDITFLAAYPVGPYLELEKTWGGSLGARFERSWLRFAADGYYREMHDVVGFDEDDIVRPTEGLAYGLETRTQVRFGIVEASLIYQFSRSLRRVEAGDPWVPSRYDQPHLINAMVAAFLPKDWIVSGRWRYASGFYKEPYTDDDAFDILLQEQRDLDTDAQGRLPAYHALDLKVSKRLTFRSWRLDVYLDVQNVYNRRIAEPIINGIDDANAVYGFGLPVLPIFGVEGAVWP